MKTKPRLKRRPRPPCAYCKLRPTRKGRLTCCHKCAIEYRTLKTNEYQSRYRKTERKVEYGSDDATTQ